MSASKSLVSCLLSATESYGKGCENDCVSHTRPGEEKQEWMFIPYNVENKTMFNQGLYFRELEVLLHAFTGVIAV